MFWQPERMASFKIHDRVQPIAHNTAFSECKQHATTYLLGPLVDRAFHGLEEISGEEQSLLKRLINALINW